MERIMVNIEGDVNIYVTEADDSPNNFCIDEDTDNSTEEMEVTIDILNATVLYAAHGQQPERMTVFEAFQRAMREGIDTDEVEQLPMDGLIIVFDSADLIDDECGEMFLIGDSIVMHMEDGNVISLTGEEEATARRILESGTITISDGTEVLDVYDL